MTKKKPNPLRRIYEWTLSLAERKLSGLWLALISFAEASFFPIPPDILLLPLCLGNLKKAFSFALICSVASVLGGLAGYAIGAFAWDGLAPTFFEYVPGFTEEKFDRIQEWYAEWGWPLVFLAGFSPIPYKIFTIPSTPLAMVNISCRLLSHSLQNIYHRQWSAWDGSSPLYSGLGSQPFCPLLFGGCIGLQIRGTNEGENRQALQSACPGIWLTSGRWISCP